MCVIAHENEGKNLDNWLCFYLSERRVLAEAAGYKCYFCTDIDLIEHAFSSLDRDVCKIFVIGIWRIHPSSSTVVCNWNI